MHACAHAQTCTWLSLGYGCSWQISSVSGPPACLPARVPNKLLPSLRLKVAVFIRQIGLCIETASPSLVRIHLCPISNLFCEGMWGWGLVQI